MTLKTSVAAFGFGLKNRNKLNVFKIKEQNLMV